MDDKIYKPSLIQGGFQLRNNLINAAAYAQNLDITTEDKSKNLVYLTFTRNTKEDVLKPVQLILMIYCLRRLCFSGSPRYFEFLSTEVQIHYGG